MPDEPYTTIPLDQLPSHWRSKLDAALADLAGPKAVAPLRDGEPCSYHPACLSHRTHPCEGCGRIAGRNTPTISMSEVIPYTPTGIEAEVCADIARRQAHGIIKYGTTVADNRLELRAWLQHAYEETLDNAVYLKRAIAEIDRKPEPALQPLNNEQREILKHTIKTGRYVCDPDADTRNLVAHGFLTDRGPQPLAGGMCYFTVTPAGREALLE